MVGFGFLVLVAILFGTVGVMFGIARLFSSFGKQENRWKRYAAIMVPTITFSVFVILFTTLSFVSSFMIGVDPLGDYEVPLRHRYTVYPDPCYYPSMKESAVLDAKNFIVVDGVNKLYMDGDILYGICVENARGYAEGFALNMHTGKFDPAEVDTHRLMSVKKFCEERDRKVTAPLDWLAALISAVAAFFAGRRYFKMIRSSGNLL